MRIGLFPSFFNRPKKCFYKINGRKTKTRKTSKSRTAGVEETAIVPVEENVEPAPKPKRTRKTVSYTHLTLPTKRIV